MKSKSSRRPLPLRRAVALVFVLALALPLLGLAWAWQAQAGDAAGGWLRAAAGAAAGALATAALVAWLLRHAASARPDRRWPLEQVLFDRCDDGIVVLDEDATVRAANPRAAALLGLTVKDLRGQPLTRWVALPGAPAGDPGGPWAVGARVDLRVNRVDGADLHCELQLSALSLRSSGRHYVATLRDVGERRAAEERMRRLADFDALTGLPNRSLFRDRLGQALERAGRTRRRVALMFLDLDRFKTVNDSLGHDAGDRLLQHVAATLTAALRGSDSVALRRAGDAVQGFTVARLGGDEFTLIVEDLAHADEARRIAERLQRALEQPFHVGTQEIVVTTSIGITVYPDDDCPADELIKHADLAMYRAKDQGRNAVQYYSAEMNDHAQRRLQMESELRHALERGEFALEYQPKADLASGRVSGVEALLRWRRDGRAVAPPDVFVPLLEETGLILPVGRWVLEQAAAQVCAWRRAGLPWVRVAVNLSGRQLRQGDIVATVAAALEASGLPSAQLELELTESMLMDGQAHAATLGRLSALGVQLAVDDFGTGYSSLGYLKRFNLDALKIDRSFVRDMPNDAEDRAIAVAVIALARSLKLRVVAEGVETPAQRQCLADHGCDEIQGYLLSRPLSPEAFEGWWRGRLAALAETPEAMAAGI